MNTCGPMYMHPFPVEIFKKFDLLERAMFFIGGGWYPKWPKSSCETRK